MDFDKEIKELGVNIIERLGIMQYDGNLTKKEAELRILGYYFCECGAKLTNEIFCTNCGIIQ